MLSFAGNRLKTVYVDTLVSTSIVIATSRVAPVKTQTILKLEFCSVLLSKLLAVQDPRHGFGDYHSSSPERSQRRSQQP